METRASYVLVGSFVLGLIAAGAAFVVWLAKIELDTVPTRYTIYFMGNVTGLQVGSAVRYRGVPIGAVSGIHIDPDNIERVKVSIDVSDSTPITADTVATLGLQGITGVAFVQLTGGTKNSPRLKPNQNGEPAVIASKQSGLEQVLEKAPELFSKAVLVADRLTKLVDDKNLKAVEDTLANLRDVTGVLADRSKNLDRVIVDTEATLGSVTKAANQVSALATQISRDTAPVSREAKLAMTDLRGTLTEARNTLAKFAETSETLEKLIAENRVPMHDFASGGLYELSQFIAEARVLVASLTRLSAQIERDPARFFFGDAQKGFEAK